MTPEGLPSRFRGGFLHYDVRGDLTDKRHRPLMMIGFPMDATGFSTLSGLFQDRPVVTYDPRGVGRNAVPPGEKPLTPRDHAEDPSLLIDALGVGVVDVFASSGGAINALALVEARADQVHTLVAHEPPVITALPDRENVLGASADITPHLSEQGVRAGDGLSSSGS